MTPGRRRSGRFLSVGPLEIETRTYVERRAFFDPGGTEDHTACTPMTDDAVDAAEETWEDAGCPLPPPTCCAVDRARYGGLVEFNWRGYSVSLTAYWRWAHRLAQATNALIWRWLYWRHPEYR